MILQSIALWLNERERERERKKVLHQFQHAFFLTINKEKEKKGVARIIGWWLVSRASYSFEWALCLALWWKMELGCLLCSALLLFFPFLWSKEKINFVSVWDLTFVFFFFFLSFLPSLFIRLAHTPRQLAALIEQARSHRGSAQH